MKKILKRIISFVITVVISITAMSVSSFAVSYKLSSFDPVDTDRYTGNMGDSFIDQLGTRNGFTATNGKTYSSGLEIWLARWNFQDEKSWVYAEYNLKRNYTELKGTLVVLDGSYNKKDFDITVDIIGDGTVLESYNILPETKNKSVSVDVTDVKKLKIYAYDNAAKSGGTSLGFVNCKLTKEETNVVKTNITSATMNIGMTLQISCVLNEGETIMWESSNKAVATVSKKGEITSNGKGSATISGMTSTGRKVSIKIKVS